MTLIISCRNQKSAFISTSFREPGLDGLHLLFSYDGLVWDSVPGLILPATIGNDHLYVDSRTGDTLTPRMYPHHMMRDPSICLGGDGRYHLVWTLAWEGEKGFGYSSSADLIDWSTPRIINVADSLPTDNVWAPEIFYDNRADYYLIAWSSAIQPDDYTEADRLGSNKAQRLYYTTTTNFSDFSKPQILYDPGFNSIDGFIVCRAPSDYVLIVKDNRKPGFSNLFCAFSQNPSGPYSNPSPPFTGSYCEGPSAINIDDSWLIYYDAYAEHRYGAVTSTDFINFTPADSIISFPKGHKHGTVIKVSTKIIEKLLNRESKPQQHD